MMRHCNFPLDLIFGGKPPVPNLSYYNLLCEERLRKTKNLRAAGFPAGIRKSGAVPIEPTCSVFRDRDSLESYV
jgi:hypothetical protein